MWASTSPPGNARVTSSRVYDDPLLSIVRNIDRSVIPASDEVTFHPQLLASLPRRELILAQGCVADASGTRPAQSVPPILHWTEPSTSASALTRSGAAVVPRG